MRRLLIFRTALPVAMGVTTDPESDPEPTNVEDHLHAALSATEDDEVNYHIRESIQKLYVDD
jgi:hypothetical protein